MSKTSPDSKPERPSVLTFQHLFVGSALAHGLWHKTGQAETVKGAAVDADYAAHLKGDVGLGLVPVREDGTCRFGAIDVDVDTIDHADLLSLATSFGPFRRFNLAHLGTL